jgi:hypothetical protein
MADACMCERRARTSTATAALPDGAARRGGLEPSTSTLDDDIRAALAAGGRVSEIAAALAVRTGLSRREGYRRAPELSLTSS